MSEIVKNLQKWTVLSKQSRENDKTSCGLAQIMGRKHKEWDINEEPPPQFRDTLNALVDELIKPEHFKRDLFLAMLLIVMKESGFQLMKGDGEYPIDIVDFVLAERKKEPDIYEAMYFLKDYENVPLRLIVRPMKDVFLINTTLPDMCKETYSICLPINRYILASRFGIPSNFANMDEFYTVFKDKVVTPIKSRILNCNNTPSGALAGLPSDVLHLISLWLPIKDILSLSAACRRLNDVVNEDVLWSQLYNRDFADTHEIEEQTWRETYIETFVSEKEKKRACIAAMDSLRDTDLELPGYLSCPRGDTRWQVLL